MSTNSLIEFNFTLDPGVSDSDIEKLWTETQMAQLAMDKFLSGEMGEYELHDYLTYCCIPIDDTLETMESNAQYMGLILP